VQGESGDLLANATRRNVTLNVEKLKAAAPILNAAVDGKKIRVGGGVYKLATGHVELVA
jgi:carbonic anhydrase